MSCARTATYDELLAENRMLKGKNGALKAENGALKAEVERLRRENAHDGGPNAPPSHRTVSGMAEAARKKRVRGRRRPAAQPRRRPGAQAGHPGATRRPAPTRHEEHNPDKCPVCTAKKLTLTGSYTRDITDIPEPPPKQETTRHKFNVHSCSVCGLEGIEAGAGLPKEGRYGKNTVKEARSNFADRLPNRANARKTGRRGVDMSAGTVHNVVRRAGTAVAGPAAASRGCDLRT